MCVFRSHFVSKAQTFCQQAACVLPPLLLEERCGDGLRDLARTSNVREPLQIVRHLIAWYGVASGLVRHLIVWYDAASGPRCLVRTDV